MKILCLGRILHELSLRELAGVTAPLARSENPDILTAGGDLLLGHAGAIRRLAEEWPDSGLQYLILSEAPLARPAIRDLLPAQPAWVRPANLPPGAIGPRFCLWSKEDRRLGLVSIVTDSDRSVDDAIRTLDELVKVDLRGVPLVVFAHGTDLELKQALFWRASTYPTPIHVLGLGLGVATADERIVSGRAWISDIGAVRRDGGIGGSDPEVWWKRHRERIPVEFAPPVGRLGADTLLLELDASGRCVNLRRRSMTDELPA